MRRPPRPRPLSLTEKNRRIPHAHRHRHRRDQRRPGRRGEPCRAGPARRERGLRQRLFANIFASTRSWLPPLRTRDSAHERGTGFTTFPRHRPRWPPRCRRRRPASALRARYRTVAPYRDGTMLGLSFANPIRQFASILALLSAAPPTGRERSGESSRVNCNLAVPGAMTVRSLSRRWLQDDAWPARGGRNDHVMTGRRHCASTPSRHLRGARRRGARAALVVRPAGAVDDWPAWRVKRPLALPISAACRRPRHAPIARAPTVRRLRHRLYRRRSSSISGDCRVRRHRLISPSRSRRKDGPAGRAPRSDRSDDRTENVTKTCDGGRLTWNVVLYPPHLITSVRQYVHTSTRPPVSTS